MGPARTHGSGGKMDPRKVGAQVSDQTLLPPGPWRAVGFAPARLGQEPGWGRVGVDSCGVGGCPLGSGEGTRLRDPRVLPLLRFRASCLVGKALWAAAPSVLFV